jgi:hypothetical protein
MPLVHAWLRAFIATLILEIPVVVWLTRDVPMGAWRRTSIAFIANLATHPIVWFVLLQIGLSGTASLVVSETWAVVIEWWVYFVAFPAMPWGRALGVSALANGFSFAVGLLLFQYTGWLA